MDRVNPLGRYLSRGNTFYNLHFRVAKPITLGRVYISSFPRQKDSRKDYFTDPISSDPFVYRRSRITKTIFQSICRSLFDEWDKESYFRGSILGLSPFVSFFFFSFFSTRIQTRIFPPILRRKFTKRANRLIHFFAALCVSQRRTGRTTFGLPRKFRVSGRCTCEGR